MSRAYRLAAAASLCGLAAACTGESSGGFSQPSGFVPSSAGYVVLEVPRGSGGAESRAFAGLVERAAGDPRLAARAARDLLQQARARRDPALFGRAETILRSWIARPDGAPAELLVLQADIEQNRHDFARALVLLDQALERRPADLQARLIRATVHLVRGDLRAAEADCRAVLGSGAGAVGSVCLAQVIGGPNPARGAALVRVWLSHPDALTTGQRVWALEVLADLAVRAGNDEAAEVALREAVRLDPQGEAVRVALAELLLDQRRAAEALAILDVDRPSTATFVQRARALRLLGRGEELRETLALTRELFHLAARRGERTHRREEALLALHVEGDAGRALTLAEENFEAQREAVDLRLLARAAHAAGDPAVLAEVDRWTRQSGIRDSCVDDILERAAP